MLFKVKQINEESSFKSNMKQHSSHILIIYANHATEQILCDKNFHFKT